MESEWSLSPRLRHVKRVLCRNLQVQGMSSLPSLRCWFELWISEDNQELDIGQFQDTDGGNLQKNLDNGQMTLLYISEKVTGTLNPEWTLSDLQDISRSCQHLQAARFVVKAHEQRSDPSLSKMQYVPEFDNNWDDYNPVTVGSKQGAPLYLPRSFQSSSSISSMSNISQSISNLSNIVGEPNTTIARGESGQSYFGGDMDSQPATPRQQQNFNDINEHFGEGQGRDRRKPKSRLRNTQNGNRKGSLKHLLQRRNRKAINIEFKDVFVDFQFDINTQQIQVEFRYLEQATNMDTVLSPLSKSEVHVDVVQNLKLRQSPLTIIDTWLYFGEMFDMGVIKIGGFNGVFLPNSIVLKVGRKFLANERPWLGSLRGIGYNPGNLWERILGRKVGVSLSQNTGSSIVPTPRRKRHKRVVAKVASFGADLDTSKLHSRGASRLSHNRNVSGTSFQQDSVGFDSWIQNSSPPASYTVQDGVGVGPGTASENRSDISGQDINQDAHVGEAKRYEEDDFIMELKKIKDCDNHLSNKQKKRDALHAQLQQALQQANRVKHQQLQLERQQNRLQFLRSQTKQLQFQVAKLKIEVKIRHEIQIKQVKASGYVLDYLIGAVRWTDAQEEEVIQKLKQVCSDVHTMIVSRRCNMVKDLAHIFKVGPKILSVWQGPSLEESLDRWWMMPLKGSLVQQQPSQSQNNVGETMQEEVIVMQNLAAAQRVASKSEWHNLGVSYKQVPRLTISGLEWDQHLVNLAKDNVVLQDQKVAEKTAAALGYAAHLVNKLSVYLGVPLRYPLVYLGSRSFIVDPAPPQQEAKMWSMYYPHDSKKLANDPRVRYLNSHRRPSSPSQMPNIPVTLSFLRTSEKNTSQSNHMHNPTVSASKCATCFPLYYVPRKGMHFDYAIFKLNTDIEQLLFLYGLTSESPMKVLQNLQKLIEHAKAGLPSS